MKPKGETKTNYVHKKRRYRELCIVSITNFSVNKSWNIANLRFFVADCPEKDWCLKKKKNSCFSLPCMLLKAKQFHDFTMW